MVDLSRIDLAPQTLSGIQLFRDLETDQRARILKFLRAKRYARDTQIISQRHKRTDVFFVISGRVRATLFSEAGREVSYEELGPGEMFGELAAIDGQPRANSVTALTDTFVASMTAEAFWQVLRDYPQVDAAVLRRIVAMTRAACERIFEFRALGVKERVHAELLRLARQAGENDNTITVEHAPTHAEIANRVATHREAVTRELKRLESMGLIDWRPARHVVLDVSRLAKMVADAKGDSTLPDNGEPMVS